MSGAIGETPRSERLHIGIFGKRNSGKSSLINALTRQQRALVSNVAGTTADPVYQAMELPGVGPVVWIDTAGFDDIGELGRMRVEKTEEALDKTDIALLVFTDGEMEEEKRWLQKFRSRKIPVVAILNQCDIPGRETLAAQIEASCGVRPVCASARENMGIDDIIWDVARKLPEDYGDRSITCSIVKEGDLVLLVMPQDIQAPKGRLILPQVQTIRELLDRKCLVMCVTTDKMEAALAAMAKPPQVIITDSQVFKTVYEKKPASSRLTSFSVLFAEYKGDLPYFVQSAAAIDCLTENSKVLIAEACTHSPLSEDIGKVKLPALLRKRVGAGLTIDMVSGQDFPKDLSGYQLVIHCGACMFNRQYVLSRVRQAVSQSVPMTNYGVAIAYLGGILGKLWLGADCGALPASPPETR